MDIVLPKEKAKELVDKMSAVGLQQRNEGIACAIIAIEEILSIPESRVVDASSPTFKDHRIHHQTISLQERKFWKEVKIELEKL